MAEPKHVIGARYVCEVPKGERVLTLGRIGHVVYAYTEKAAYRVDLERNQLVRVDQENT